MPNWFKQSMRTGQRLFFLLLNRRIVAFRDNNREILIPEILPVVSHFMLICSSDHPHGHVVVGPS